MGLRLTQGDENRIEEGLAGNYTNFVISTGAKRSGEICGFPHLAQRRKGRARYGAPSIGGHFGSILQADLGCPILA